MNNPLGGGSSKGITSCNHPKIKQDTEAGDHAWCVHCGTILRFDGSGYSPIDSRIISTTGKEIILKMRLPGKPESVESLKDTLKFINEQLVKNPLATTKEGIPYLLHFMIIRRGLYELISIREQERRLSNK